MTEDGNNNKKYSVFSKFVEAGTCIVVLAVVACLMIGIIIIGRSSVLTSETFNKECKEVLRQIDNLLIADESAYKIRSNDSEEEMESNTVASSEISDKITSDTINTIEAFITHMERMVAIQKSGMTNDLMSFIYGILSTILVGLCAVFVAKSRASAEEAKSATETVNVYVNNEKRSIEEWKTTTETVTKQFQDAMLIEKKLEYQLRIILISGRISSAKVALLDFDYIVANRYIIQIRDEISSLSTEEEFKRMVKSDGFNLDDIGKLYDEINGLNDSINFFLNGCKDRFVKDPAHLKTITDAAENYCVWIEIALRYLNNI